MAAAAAATSSSIFKRFGDQQSTLLDQHERLSFEVQLNKAMQLGRSLSEPGVARCSTVPLPPPPKQQLVWKPCPPAVRRGGHRRYSSGFKKVMRKLFSPILGNKAAKDVGSPIPNKEPIFWKTFARSLRV